MLSIRAEHMTALDDHARRRFVGELRVALATKYPHCLPSFPVPVQEQIVRNMLGRAARWGITWKSALVAFAETMLAVAPNFDEHAEVRAMMRSTQAVPNRAMLSIDQRLSKTAWLEIESNAQNLPLFVPSKWIEASLVDQIAVAIPILLGDVLSEADPHGLAVSAVAMADSLGLDRIADAGLILTARRLLYADQLRERTNFPWTADVFDKPRAPQEMISLLRLRISLDFQRFV